MNIYNILLEKEKVLKHYGLPTAVTFTLDEIDELADKSSLRAFKLFYRFPADFKRSRDIVDCTKHIVEGDNIYRVLEFCIMKNRILRQPVISIFPKLGEANDLRT